MPATTKFPPALTGLIGYALRPSGSVGRNPMTRSFSVVEQLDRFGFAQEAVG